MLFKFFSPEKVSSANNDNSSFVHPAVNVLKRALDICIAIVGITLLTPVVPLIALAIKLDSKGPVFYGQKRLGKTKNQQREVFTIFKFRTMRTDAESDGVARLAQAQDPRITAIGKYLRKTRLDEIPQLLNVLSGQMSFIGPRPERPELTRSLDKKMPFFSERNYHVRPGLTGLAQINQSYQGSVNNIDEKLAYDHAYSLTLSQPTLWLLTDIKILCRTVLTVLKCNG